MARSCVVPRSLGLAHLCGMLGSLHSGKDPPRSPRHILSGDAGPLQPTGLHPPASQARLASVLRPWTPVSFWCPSADPVLILLHPEYLPCLVHLLP